MIDALAKADEDYYPNVRQLLIIGCTAPIGTCEAERSFSTFRRIKTYLRNNMSQERMSALALMNIHRSDTYRLNEKDLMKDFIVNNRRRFFCQSIVFETENSENK